MIIKEENLKKIEKTALLIALFSVLIGLFSIIIISRPTMKTGDFKISLQKAVKSIGNSGKADAKEFSKSEITLSDNTIVKFKKLKALSTISTSPAKVEKKKSVSGKKFDAIAQAKKKKHDAEEKEIFDHIENAKKRYFYYMVNHGEMTIDSCEKKGIEPDFGIALFLNEGGGDRYARSDSGALGICQLMRRTAIRLWNKRHEKIPKNIDSALCVPQVSMSLGTDHIKESLDFFESPVKAAIAYWAGNNGVYNYFCKYDGKDVDVEYYRIVYGIYKWIKDQKGERCSPAMKPARPSEIIPNVQIAQD
jgi:hypothetical protein